MAVLAALLVGYVLYYRFTLPDQRSSIGAVEAAALFASDPYYVLYVVNPAWLIAVFLSVRREVDPQAVIRVASRRRWLGRILSQVVAVRLAAVALVVIAVWMIAGAGLVLTPDWVAFLENPDSTVFSAALGPTGLSPFGLLGAQALALITAGIASAATIAAVYILNGRTGMAAVIAIVMYVAPIVGHVLSFLPAGPLALLSPGNYLSPLVAQTSLGAWWAGSAVCLLWTVGLMALTALVDRRVTRVRWTLRFTYAGYATLCSVLILGVVLTFTQARGDLLSSLYFIFQGATPGGSALLLYLLATIVFLTPAYLTSASFESRLDGRIYYELIRHGSYRRAVGGQLMQGAFVAVLTTGGTAVIAVAAWAIGTGGMGPLIAPATDGQPTLNPAVVTYIFFVNGVLQMLFYLSLSITLIMITGRSASSLIGLGVIVILGFYPLTPWPLLPVYLNSLSYAPAGWLSALSASAILLLFTILTLLLLAFNTRSRGLII